MNAGKVLLLLLAGAAAGTLLGVLFAPDSGWMTRKRISKKGEDCAEELIEKFNKLLSGVKERFDPDSPPENGNSIFQTSGHPGSLKS
jgi:gas vesicle protein